MVDSEDRSLRRDARAFPVEATRLLVITVINGYYRGQNASVIKHNQSALDDKPAT